MFGRNFLFFWISLGFIGLGLSTLFNNCAGSSFSTLSDGSSLVAPFKIEDDPSLVGVVDCLPKEALNGAPVKSKLNFKDLDLRKYSEEVFDDDHILTNSVLIVKVSHQCLAKSNTLSAVSRTIKERPEGLIADIETGAYQYSFPSVMRRSEFETLIDSDPCILFVDKNAVFEISSAGDVNDQYYTQQKYLQEINHSQIYKKIFNSQNGINKEVRLAIIDSGMDTTNPDLTANVLRDQQDKVIGLNAIDNSAEVADAGFHGTHVAGIAGASSGNTVGISGVLGSSIKLIPIRVSVDGTRVDMDAVINGINWATQQKADVINMSLSSTGPGSNRPLFQEAIANAIANNVLVVVAAGNDGQMVTENSQIYPMKYAASMPGLISVGSVDALTNAISSFSNRSSTYVKIMAPGSSGNDGILSTVPSRVSALGYANKVGGNPIHGTSMASPMVAGAGALVTALVRSRGFKGSPEQVERALTAGSVQDPNLINYSVKGQRLDLSRLIALVDRETGISSDSTTPRTEASGMVSIATQPLKTNALVGSPIKLEVTPSSDSSIFLNYQWYRNGRPLPGAESSSLLVPKTTESHAGLYQVEISAGATKVRSSKVRVTLGKAECKE